MRKIGIYYAFWVNDWNVDFIPFVNKVADLGFDILEVNAGTIAAMSSAQRLALRQAADNRSIQLTYCIGLPSQYDVSSDSPTIQREGVTFLENITRAIGEMGGGKLSGIIYGSWPSSVDAAKNKPRRLETSIKNMKEAVKVAEDNAVFFNVEVVNRYEQFLLNTCDEALDYVKKVDSPNLKILLDTFHMNIEEDNIGAAIRKAGKQLGHLHIGENNRKPPSYGHIPWQEIRLALDDIHYDESIVMEPFLMPGGEIGRDIKVWRPIMPGCNFDLEAKHALDFVRKVLI